jgi:IMP dehydrogenase
MLPDSSLREALTFDDVLLVPAESEVIPKDVDVRSHLTASITLAIPILSSAMDTVTEAPTAICMAREGGLGVIHKNMTIDEQVLEVTKVKKAETGVVIDPVTIDPDQKLFAALELMRRHEISGLPVVGRDGKPVGILTNRDVRFERNLDQPVRDVMTTNLITAPEGMSLEGSKELLHKNRIEKLLVIDSAGKLHGLITIKDIEKGAAAPVRPRTSSGDCAWAPRWAPARICRRAWPPCCTPAAT